MYVFEISSMVVPFPICSCAATSKIVKNDWRIIVAYRSSIFFESIIFFLLFVILFIFCNLFFCNRFEERGAM